MFGPFVEMARLQNEINKIFESLLDVSPEDSLKAASGWVPNLDVLHSSENVMVMAELPGVDPSKLKLAVSSGHLTITGEKPRSKTVKGAKYHCLERGHGSFSRTVQLPEPVNTHQAKAVFCEGLLTVSFPRVRNRRGQAIEIPITTE